MAVTIRPNKLKKKKAEQEQVKFSGMVEGKPRGFLNTGSRVLNLALSGDAWNGGWAIGRVINIVGDTTTGKTLLACEAVNQLYYYWHLQQKKVACGYKDAEAAFDFSLAAEFGMPLDWIRWAEPNTIQEYFTGMYKQVSLADKYDLLLEILDSLDGISEDAEISRAKKLAEGKKVDGTYGTQKAKEMSAGLRLLSTNIREKNMINMIISQVRMRIGDVSRVRSYSRNGGKALDHYASQIVWLSEVMPITRTITVRKQPKKLKIGKRVQVRVSKNRLYREGAIVTLDIIDRYGIDDVGSMLNWLDEWDLLKKEKGSLVLCGVKASRPKLIETIENNKVLYRKVVNLVQSAWDQLEKKLKPGRKPKYGS